MDLILKSSTSDYLLADVGVVVKAGAGSTFNNIPSLLRALAQSSDLRARVIAGTTVVNNGVSDLSAADGQRYLNQLWLMSGNDVAPQMTQVEGVVSDTQHGTRGGGTLHPQAVAGGASGFLSGTDQDKLNRIQGGNVTNEPHGFPNRTDSTISFTSGSRLFQIAPTGVSYDIYIKGVKYTKSGAESTNITDTEGIWYFYFDGTGALVASQTPWSIINHVPIAYVYWDSAGDTAIIFGEERHGVIMDSQVHEYLHNTVGARFWNGLTATGSIIGDGSLDAHAQVALANGDVYDEDLLVSIRHAAVPTPPFQQYLTPIAQIPVYYLSGTGQWRRWATTNFPAHLGAARLVYNLYSVPNWTTPDVDTNGKYMAMWLFATNNRSEPVIAVLGQRQDTSLGEAQQNNVYQNMSLPNLPFAECKVLYRLIYQTSATYANAIKARLRDILDMRSVSVLPAGTYSPAPLPVFGESYSEANQAGQGSVTGIVTWFTFLALTTPVLQPGKYRISYSYGWDYSTLVRSLSRRVIVDRTGTAVTIHEAINEKVDVTDYSHDGGSWTLDLTGQAAAAHTIEIQGMPASVGDTAYMRYLHIDVFRVS